VRFFRRRRRHERPLTEAEAYARSYGERDGEVKIVSTPAPPPPPPPPLPPPSLSPRRPRYKLRISGEDLRRMFEERLNRRDSG
jgi:hypothetical protein